MTMFVAEQRARDLILINGSKHRVRGKILIDLFNPDSIGYSKLYPIKKLVKITSANVYTRYTIDAL